MGPINAAIKYGDRHAGAGDAKRLDRFVRPCDGPNSIHGECRRPRPNSDQGENDG